MEQQRIGVIGLGKMGLPMVRRLCVCGFTVSVHDLSEKALTSAEEAGGYRAGSLSHLVENSDVIILSLPDSAAVEAVVVGRAGLCCSNLLDKVVIDTSTIPQETAVRCAAAVSAAGGGYLDAPVTGGVSGSSNGTLTFFVGGTVADFSKVQPLWEALGQKATLVGPHGHGALVKLLFQIVGSAKFVAAAEAFALAKVHGVDPERLIASLGESHPLSDIASRDHEGRWGSEGYLAQRGKDLEYALAEAEGVGLTLPMTAAMVSLFQQGKESGLSSNDPQALTLLFGRRRG